MTAAPHLSEDITHAKALLEGNGFVVLRERSYRQAQERQRVAEALARDADEQRARTHQWVREDLGPEARRLRERLTFVYGVARAHGATVEELHGPDTLAGAPGIQP